MINLKKLKIWIDIHFSDDAKFCTFITDILDTPYFSFTSFYFKYLL